MEETLLKFDNTFPTLPQDVLRKINNCRLERVKIFTRLGLPEDICWVIEAKVRLVGEFQDSYNRFMLGMRRNSYSKRAKRIGVCHKCARWTCDTHCRNIGMASINREDKIQFLKDGLRKESLDDIRLTLETHVNCVKVGYSKFGSPRDL